MTQSRNNGQGPDLTSLLQGALRAAAQQSAGQAQTAGIFGGLGDLLGAAQSPPRKRQTRTTRPRATGGADVLGGILGALFGSKAARSRTAKATTGAMAVGTLALDYLKRWAQQSQQGQQIQQEAPGGQAGAGGPFAPGAGQGASSTAPTPWDGHGIPQVQQQTQPFPQQAQPAPSQQPWSQQWNQQAPQGQWGPQHAPDYQQQNQQPVPQAPPADTELHNAGWGRELTTPTTPAAPAAQPPSPAVLLLLAAMVNAAKADGHMDASERENIRNAMLAFIAPEELDAYIAPLLDGPADAAALAAHVQDIEQARDIYRLSCAAVELDSFAERSYLDSLGNALYLAPDVRQRLEAEALALQGSVQSV